MGHICLNLVGVKSALVRVLGASLSNYRPQELLRRWFFFRALTWLQAPGVVLEASGVARSRFFSARKVTHLRWVTFGGSLWE